MSDNEEIAVVIKPAKSRILLNLGIAWVFVIVGIGLMALPANRDSTLFLRLVQSFVGIVSILFGFAGCIAIVMKAKKPIIAIYEDRICYQKEIIPWSDIREVRVVEAWGGQKVRWIYIYVHNPQHYEAHGKLNKRFGVIDADLVFDFSLATQADFRKACQYLHVNLHEITFDP